MYDLIGKPMIRSTRNQLLFLILICFTLNASVSAQDFKESKIIYLWDVTLSMKGYNGSPNIYNKVKDALVRSIEGIEDESSTVTVIPFQDKILDTWSYPATKTGKKQLVDKIKQLDNDNITNTNICHAWDYTLEQLIAPQKSNFVCLLTDGTDNVMGTDELCQRIIAWCKSAKANNAYAAYVMLTEAAQNDSIRNAVRASCNFDLVELDENNFVFPAFFRPAANTVAKELKQLQQDGEIRFTINPQVKGDKLAGVNLTLAPNDYFTLEKESISCTDNVCTFRLNSRMSFKRLHQRLPKIRNLHLTVESTDKYQVINFNEIKIQIINYPEKTLHIHVKD